MLQLSRLPDSTSRVDELEGLTVELEVVQKHVARDGMLLVVRHPAQKLHRFET